MTILSMPEGDYVCTLPPHLVEVARTELRETESRRNQALDQFRELIKLHPRIKKCQMDTISLLRFLRAKKFSVMAAMDLLEKHLISMQEFSHWYHNLSLDDTKVCELLNSGHICPLLQKDKHGRQVVINNGSKIDANKFTSSDVIRTTALLYSYFCMKEDFQVAGFVVVFDATNVTLKTLSLFSITDLHDWLTSVQKSIPLRLKAIHIVNLPSIANAFLKVGVSAMGQKMQKRVFLHKSQIEFQNAFDTPEILPLEYGGTISTDDMVTELKKNLNNERIRILNGDNQEIEIIKESGDWLRSGDKNLGLAGSFRKLEID